MSEQKIRLWSLEDDVDPAPKPKPGRKPEWTTAEVKEALRLRNEERLSAAAIAQRLGKASASAVQAQFSRHGLTGTGFHGHPSKLSEEKWAEVISRAKGGETYEDMAADYGLTSRALSSGARKRGFKKPRQFYPQSAVARGFKVRQRKTKKAAPAMEPPSLDLSLLDLTPRTCRWPYGDGPFTFCGHPCDPVLPYCDYHMEQATTTQAQRHADNTFVPKRKQVTGFSKVMPAGF